MGEPCGEGDEGRAGNEGDEEREPRGEGDEGRASDEGDEDRERRCEGDEGRAGDEGDEEVSCWGRMTDACASSGVWLSPHGRRAWVAESIDIFRNRCVRQLRRMVVSVRSSSVGRREHRDLLDIVQRAWTSCMQTQHCMPTAPSKEKCERERSMDPSSWVCWADVLSMLRDANQGKAG